MIDFARIDENHQKIHQELCNWASWVTVRQGSQIHPMWRQSKSNAWQWHTPEYRETCDTLGAMEMEKRVSKLPVINRDAVRWAYVYKSHPRKIMRKLGVSAQGLADAIRVGRQMLA